MTLQVNLSFNKPFYTNYSISRDKFMRWIWTFKPPPRKRSSRLCKISFRTLDFLKSRVFSRLFDVVSNPADAINANPKESKNYSILEESPSFSNIHTTLQKERFQEKRIIESYIPWQGEISQLLVPPNVQSIMRVICDIFCITRNHIFSLLFNYFFSLRIMQFLTFSLQSVISLKNKQGWKVGSEVLFWHGFFF